MSSVYAVVNNGVVVNTVMWDGQTEWKAENGSTVLADVPVGIGWLYDGAAFHEPPPLELTSHELVAAAEQKKSALLTEAQGRILNWQTDLLLGIISDSDKNNLMAWRIYMKNLESIDINHAPDIVWPDHPVM
ncbi:tail fiber assembly protein [Brenneria uluponensis]|uniref:tail fiber assembly protein n=1 Tax=Brenneria uluponensis TaxID=3057057 RepID=UPI0028F0B1B0|nr:tail fiber assembly protein [Brenneria ulupoensis]